MGRPSCVVKRAFSVPSRDSAVRWRSSEESGTVVASWSRRLAGRFVMSSYEFAPLDVHSQIWRRRKPGSPASSSVLSRSFRSTGTKCGSVSVVRLAKYLAHSGVASRRAAEKLIAAGRVSVDGAVVTDPAFDVSSGVSVDGSPVAPEPREVYALNKPAGVVSTAHDPQGRRTVTALVPSERRLYPVGRLDADSTGLILLTNDGELANRLTHPRYEVPKVYVARVVPDRVPEPALRALRDGIELEDGPTSPARVRAPRPGVLEIEISEGRKRQVRRMCEAVGHRVVELERVAFGPLRLGGLEPGRFRRLSGAEVERLRAAARMARP